MTGCSGAGDPNCIPIANAAAATKATTSQARGRCAPRREII
jgi:hypothetical protein